MRTYGRRFVNAAMNLQVPKNTGNFMTSGGPVRADSPYHAVPMQFPSRVQGYFTLTMPFPCHSPYSRPHAVSGRPMLIHT
jgi:hypothetical protein